eukprot:CAMPEP_0181343742 /NCGR_PEP_ID=MMETSP1101-20121128/31761_1 /TAXON_ID=46948 /ORGANISM="Rhodomonas abbreviata, Strain Caron Lab Isolate" /LENGTH=198 /DNA_ID=CAMNT_0023455417 /DNA_START=5 /DNA_END=601 /DNA_ORIENTATION=-
MTTIGYGDLYPVTRFGRICAVASCFVSVALFALTLNLVLAFLTIDRDEDNFLRTTRCAHARRKVKESAAHVIEAIYMRSPMYSRLAQKSELSGYQAIVMMETYAAIGTPRMPQDRPFGTSCLTTEELENLHLALDDGEVMDKLRRFRRWKLELEHRQATQESDEVFQVNNLAEIQWRTEKQLAQLRKVVHSLAKLAKE